MGILGMTGGSAHPVVFAMLLLLISAYLCTFLVGSGASFPHADEASAANASALPAASFLAPSALTVASPNPDVRYKWFTMSPGFGNASVPERVSPQMVPLYKWYTRRLHFGEPIHGLQANEPVIINTAQASTGEDGPSHDWHRRARLRAGGQPADDNPKLSPIWQPAKPVRVRPIFSYGMSIFAWMGLCSIAFMLQPSTASHRHPPAKGPEMERTYSFRDYAQDTWLWCINSNAQPAQQCSDIIQKLQGAARRIA